MPTEPNPTDFYDSFADLWSAWGELKADHDALMQVLMEEIPPTEALRVVRKYNERRKALNQRALLDLEVTNPSFAAALDRRRPLIDPNDLSGPAH